MENKDLYQSLFALMQEPNDIMNNIDLVKEAALDYDSIDLGELNALDERFYNFLLMYLRSTTDNLWHSAEHRIQVYSIIKEQLDAYCIAPDPYSKDKYYT
jgi:hypothetical protein